MMQAVQRNPIAELEAWKSGRKARWCMITFNDGYDPTCWRIELHGEDDGCVFVTEAFYFCSKANAIPNNVIFLIAPDELGGPWDDWPGLGPVILAAIDHWNKGPHFRIGAKQWSNRIPNPDPFKKEDDPCVS